MDDFPSWFRNIERVMEWWINATPQWMQPKWVWSVYYFVID
jgi:hypothetical protein